MRLPLGCLVAVAAVTARVGGAERQDQLFESWEQAQRGVKSLVVNFTLERKDPAFGRREQSEGTLLLIRTSKGEVFASYEVVSKKPMAEERLSCLLHKGSIYLLKHGSKTAIKIEAEDGDLPRFLERYFNPFVLLLDKKRAVEKCNLEVVKQDEWYTYLVVKPKQVRRYGWFPDSFHEGQVVLMNKTGEDVPKDMPKQLWYTDGTEEYTFEIKLWKLNAVDAPKAEEFMHPRDRPDWKVIEKPLQIKK